VQSVLGPAGPAMLVSPWALVFTSR
jgi:hypothetical protein